MKLDDLYSQLILEQSKSQHNRRELADYTRREQGRNPSCGDEITLMIKIDGGVLADMSYTGHGCAISQASSSIMIDQLRRLPLEQATELCQAFIDMVKGKALDEGTLDALGDAVAFENIQHMPARVKCAVMPWYTLKQMMDEERGEA